MPLNLNKTDMYNRKYLLRKTLAALRTILANYWEIATLHFCDLMNNVE